MIKQAPTFKLHIDMLNKIERKIIKDVSKEIFESGEYDVFLRPLERVGQRQTKIFITFYVDTDGTRSRVFVLKIAEKKYIERDYSGWNNHLKNHIDAELKPPKYEGNIGIIIYQHAGAFNLEDIDKSKELDEILFEDVSSEKQIQIFKDIYEIQLKNLNEGKTKEKCKSLLEEYDWYLRDDRVRKLIHSWFGLKINDDFINFFEFDVRNPLKFLDEFVGFKQETEIVIKKIHGDLHPRNVILNKNLEPKLIDFEWANKKHALKDYVLMECSIKFFQMDTTLPLRQFMDFEKQLLEFRKNYCAFNATNTQIFLDSYTIISYIREKAKEFCIWENKEAEYLCALFLVSYGLLSSPNCNSLYCLGSLGLMAEKLKDCNLEDLKPRGK